MSVLKVDFEEKERIEQWTRDNTFPNIIQFIEDADGNWIIGEEVLADPAYRKLGVINGVKQVRLKDHLETVCTRIDHKPKEETPISRKKSSFYLIWLKIKKLWYKIVGKV